MGVLPAYVYTMCLPKKARESIRSLATGCQMAVRDYKGAGNSGPLGKESAHLMAEPLLHQRPLSNIPGPSGC